MHGHGRSERCVPTGAYPGKFEALSRRGGIWQSCLAYGLAGLLKVVAASRTCQCIPGHGFTEAFKFGGLLV
jgi:hypothetical protein